MKKLFINSIFIFIFSSTAIHAIINFEDGIYPELATSGRALAMGNAFIAKADDTAAVFYNPAGLGTVRGARFHLSNFHLETNRDWMKLATSGSISDGASNFAKGFKADGLRELLVDNKGKIANSRFQMLPNFTTRFFSIGYLISKRMRATIGQEDDALFELADRRDHGPYAAFNVSLFGGIWKFGASAIWLNRKEAIIDVDPATTIELGDADYAKGSAAIITAGVKLTLPVAFLPVFAAKINNAGAQKFSKSGSKRPDKILQTMDIGFSLTPQIGKQTRLHFEANYRDLSQKDSAVSSARRIALGMELDLARTFFFRLGYGDGYGSAGLGIKSQTLEFDLTTYAVDTTSSEFRGKEDRRFSLTLSSGF